MGSVGAALILCRLALEPFAGEVNAAFLSTGIAIAFTLLWIELYRRRDPSEVDRLVDPARTIYFTVLLLVAPMIAHPLVHTEPGAPDWLRALAYPVVLATVLFLEFVLAHLLCRISFSAAERAGDQAQRRTVVQLAAAPCAVARDLPSIAAVARFCFVRHRSDDIIRSGGEAVFRKRRKWHETSIG
jgi:hypothetical protein